MGPQSCSLPHSWYTALKLSAMSTQTNKTQNHIKGSMAGCWTLMLESVESLSFWNSDRSCVLTAVTSFRLDFLSQWSESIPNPDALAILLSQALFISAFAPQAHGNGVPGSDHFDSHKERTNAVLGDLIKRVNHYAITVSDVAKCGLLSCPALIGCLLFFCE